MLSPLDWLHAVENCNFTPDFLSQFSFTSRLDKSTGIDLELITVFDAILTGRQRSEKFTTVFVWESDGK